MKLGDFNVGDKVRYKHGVAIGRIIYAEILYIGESAVLLRNSNGLEFLREKDAYDFVKWLPDPTYDELKKENETLRTLGDNLDRSISNAAWDCNLRNPTPHMQEAVEMWRNRV